MVVLRNLKRKDNIVEYDYFPEDAGDRGHVVYDIDKKEVISKKLAKRDVYCNLKLINFWTNL